MLVFMSCRKDQQCRLVYKMLLNKDTKRTGGGSEFSPGERYAKTGTILGEITRKEKMARCTDQNLHREGKVKMIRTDDEKYSLRGILDGTRYWSR